MLTRGVASLFSKSCNTWGAQTTMVRWVNMLSFAPNVSLRPPSHPSTSSLPVIVQKEIAAMSAPELLKMARDMYQVGDKQCIEVAKGVQLDPKLYIELIKSLPSAKMSIQEAGKVVEDIEDILAEMKQFGIELRPPAYVPLLIAAQSTPRVPELFKKLQEEGLLMTPLAYTILIKALVLTRRLPEALNALEDLKSKHPLNHNPLIVHNAILLGMLQGDYSVKEVEDYFEKIKAEGIHPTIDTYCIVISRYAKAQDYGAVARLEQEINTSGIAKDKYIYARLIPAYLKARNFLKVDQLLEEVKRLGFALNVPLYTDLIEHFYREGQPNKARELLNEMKKFGVPTPTSFVQNITENNNSLEAAESLLQVGADIPESVAIQVIDRYLERNEVDKLVETTKHLCQQATPHPILINRAVNYLVSNNMDKAQQVADSGRLPTHAYCKLLEGWFQQDNLSQVQKVLDIMQRHQVAYDRRVYGILIREYKRLNLTTKAKELMEESRQKGIQGGSASPPERPTASYNRLIKQHKQAGDMKSAQAVLEDMRKQGVSPDLYTYNTLLSGYVREKNVDKAEQMVAELTTSGFKPDRWTYNLLLGLYVKIGFMGKAEGAMEKMKQDGLSYDLVTLNTMVGGYARYNPTKIPYIMDMITQLGFSVDVFTYASLAQAYIDTRNIAKAKETIAEMKSKGFSTDIIDFKGLEAE